MKVVSNKQMIFNAREKSSDMRMNKSFQLEIDKIWILDTIKKNYFPVDSKLFRIFKKVSQSISRK